MRKKLTVGKACDDLFNNERAKTVSKKEKQLMLNLTKGKVHRPVKAVVYGPEGIGKSTLAAQAPDAVFFDLEAGSHQLDVRRLEGIMNRDDLVEALKEIAETPGICKTVIVDTADAVEALCVKSICEKYHQTGLESFGYGKGYTYLQEEFSEILKSLDKLISVGINVIVIGHAKMRKFELPNESGSYDRWEFKLTKQVAPILKEWADMVLFVNYKTLVVADENGTKKAHGGSRVVYTSHHPCWDAKNRFGMPEEMDLDIKVLAPLYEWTDFNAADVTPIDQLRERMAEDGVTEAEIQKVVADKGHYSAETPVAAYEDRFIRGWLLAHWDKILPIIKENRTA